jgi:alpha-glucoside transport system substrate-binding protein
MKKRRFLVLGVLAAVAAIVAATLTPGGSAKPNAKRAGSVSILSLWGGSEKSAFLKTTAGFTKKTGIKVNYETARNYEPILRTRVAAGNPPNIAIIPSPAILLSFAKQGALKDAASLGLSKGYLAARFNTGLTDLVTYKGKIYGVPAKGNSKSLVWYRPEDFKKYGVKPAKTWAQLVSLTSKIKAKGQTPWAVGAGDGWPLTDWFEDIYIRSAGPDKYQKLFTGKVPFTDASVKKALKYFTDLLTNDNVAGGLEGALGTKFVDGIGQVFGTKPKAQLYVEGGFVGGIATQQVNTKLKPLKTIASFPFPTINPKYGSKPVVYGGDYVVAFSDSPEVKNFLKYITSPAAGKVWVSTGAVTSPNKTVPLSAYKSPLVKAEALQIKQSNAIRYDGSDQLPTDFQADWQGGLQKIFGKPSDMNKILAQIQKKAKNAFK